MNHWELTDTPIEISKHFTGFLTMRQWETQKIDKNWGELREF